MARAVAVAFRSGVLTTVVAVDGLDEWFEGVRVNKNEIEPITTSKAASANTKASMCCRSGCFAGAEGCLGFSCIGGSVGKMPVLYCPGWPAMGMEMIFAGPVNLYVPVTPVFSCSKERTVDSGAFPALLPVSIACCKGLV